MLILFLPTKMCHPQCRDEERCAENHSNDHNFALETIQMPSFWEHTRLDVPHVPGVATRVSTRSIAITCAPTSLAAPPPDIPAHARWIPPRALESPSARENPPRAEIIRAGGSVAPSLFLLV